MSPMIQFPDTMKIWIGNDAQGVKQYSVLNVADMATENVVLGFSEGVGTKARDKSVTKDTDAETIEATLEGRDGYVQDNIFNGRYSTGGGRKADAVLEGLRAYCIGAGKKKSKVSKWDREDVKVFFQVHAIDFDAKVARIEEDIAEAAMVMATVNVEEALDEE